MGEKTAIEWTGPNGKTWSPWFGCTKVHAGCTHCYAETDNRRYNRNGDHRRGIGASWGKGAPRKPRAESGWKLPLEWAREAAEAGERWKVFPSLCDPLDEEAPKDAQERFWQLIRDTADLRHGADPDLPMGGLTWILLTKRPERWQVIPEDVRPLVWLLASVSDQPTADKYVPLLLRAEGFGLLGLSVEPMVGPVNLAVARSRALEQGVGRESGQPWPPLIGWVLCGGESGPKRRTADVAWYQALADQCAAGGVPFFMKQDVGLYPGEQGLIPDKLWSRKEFPEVLRGA